MMNSPTPLSVVILTKNEERFIARAIASVWWADQVLILDSGSTDSTLAIATAMGAVVRQQEWLGWRLQHEAAAHLAAHDWILSIDADEIVTTELGESVLAAMNSNPDPPDGYVLERREEFLGTLMPNMRRRKKRKSFVRLYNRRFGRYDPDLDIHEQIRCPGRLIPLNGALLHWRNYTLGQQVHTLNRNADIEARMILKSGQRPGVPHLLLKPLARFFWLYVLCGNWRFGIKGYTWSLLHAGAEFLRQAKAWESHRVEPAIDPDSRVWEPSEGHKRKLAAGKID
jgi:glycosyltransferase involved in cell wall biosynthesis